MKNALLKALQQQFITHAHVENSIGMAKYMKNQFQFYGIKTPLRRQLQKQLLKQMGLPAFAKIAPTVKQAYAQPQREFHYFACDLVNEYFNEIPASFIVTAEYMIVTHAWWDTVDGLSSKLVGHLVSTYPELAEVMDQWVHHDNFWLQRTAILHQLKYKDHTDVERLFHYCRCLSDSKEFFIQKAIGWALREYSKINAMEVEQFVNNSTLAPLSQREAMKWIKKQVA